MSLILICLQIGDSYNYTSDLHRLVEYVQVGNQIQVSHSLLHTLFTTTHPSSTKLMVIGTMTTVDEVALDDPSTLGLPKLFTQHQLVPLLGPDEARNIHRYVFM